MIDSIDYIYLLKLQDACFITMNVSCKQKRFIVLSLRATIVIQKTHTFNVIIMIWCWVGGSWGSSVEGVGRSYWAVPKHQVGCKTERIGGGV